MVNAPVPPFGGVDHIGMMIKQFLARTYDKLTPVISTAVDPAGQELALTVEHVTRESAWNTGWRTYTIPIGEGGKYVGQPVHRSGFTDARTQNPAYSPDGKYLAILYVCK